MTPEELAKLPEYDYDKIIREEKPDASDQLRAAFVEEMEGRLYGRQQTLDAFAWFWSGWAASSGARSRYVPQQALLRVLEAARDYTTERQYQNVQACREDQDRREGILIAAIHAADGALRDGDVDE